jgi:hypothetical protein
MVGVEVQHRENWTFIEGLPFPYLNALRDAVNADYVYPPDRIPFPESKFAFERFVQENGGRAAQTRARILDGQVHAGMAPPQDPRAYIAALPHGQYYAKPDIGQQGKGTHRIDVSSTGIRVDRRREEVDAFFQKIAAEPYLIQDSLVAQQHPGIARFNADVLNTLRLTVFDSDSGPVAVAGMMRIGNGTMVVDNFSAGGCGVPVDLKKGFMTPLAMIKRWPCI